MNVGRYTAYNLLGAALPIVLALVTVPLYISLVGAQRYGVLAIAWLLLGYFGLFDLGLGRATSFRIAALRDATAERRASTFWTAFAVNVAMGVVGGAALWLAGSYFFANVFNVDEQLRPEILRGVPLLAAAVPIATLTGVLTGALQGREKFLQTNTVSVLSTGLFQLLPLAIAWKHGPDLVWLLWGSIGARALGLLVLGYYCWRELTRGHRPRIARDEFPALMKYGGWVTITSVMGPLFVILDRFLIGATLGAAAVAVYTVPFQLAQRIAVLPNALANALFPRMSSAPPDERRQLEATASQTLACILTFPVIVVILLIDPFLHVWVGPVVGAESAPVGRILVVGFWLNAFALMPFTRLQASGRPDLVTAALVLQAPFYFPGLYFGLKLYGLPGAAVVFAIRCLADYLLLTAMAGRDFRGWKFLAVNLALLILAIVVATTWKLGDLRWWFGSASLGGASLLLGWLALPIVAKAQLTSRALMLWPGRP